MSILCVLFGHKANADNYGGSGYMRVSPRSVDGIGREHAWLYAKCPRCYQTYMAGSIHLPERASEQWLKAVFAHQKNALDDAREQLAAITLGGM